MSLPELCIRRPVMTTLVMLSFIIFGLFAYRQLPVAALPRVDYPTISVSASLPGASPETMAASVASPLERQFANISGISSMTSLSSQGSTSITIQFDLDRNIDGAALDVQSAISAAARSLPQQMPNPPSFRKVNPADQPILFLSFTSNTVPLSTVHEYAETVIAQQISQISGVAQVRIFGSQKYAVRIELDPEKVFARGLTLLEVRNAVVAANSNAPVGTMQGEKQVITIQATGQLPRAADYRNLTVSYRNAAPVRLDEIATVEDSVADNTVAAWFNDDRAIVLAVTRQSDANTVETIDKIKANIPKYQAQVPPSVEIAIRNDRSVSIRQSVEDVEFTLGLAILLVILVIFLFLKSLAATLIPALALPVSLIGTFAVMYVGGYSIDNISLLALTLAVGFVVDDAIVMLENIVRYTELGMKPFAAAIKGSREIGFTIVSITLSLVAVFIPVFFMSGVVGRVFREFAVVMAASILVSGFVSLTLTPMLCARLLSAHDHHKKPGLFSRSVDYVLDGVANGYRITLDWVLKLRLLMLLVVAATIYGSYYLVTTTPAGFFPIEDTGFVVVSTEAAPDTSFEAMVERQQQVLALIRQDPAVDSSSSAVGFGAQNLGNLFVTLKPRDQRKDSALQIAQRFRLISGKVPGISVIAQPIQNINLNGGRASRSLYQYTLQSGDTDALYRAAPDMTARLAKLPILRDVNSDLRITNPQLFVDIDREKAATYGISADTIRQTLNAAFGGASVSTIYTPATQYDVVMEADKDFQADPRALYRLYLKATNGAAGASLATSSLVPLAAMATVRSSVGPLNVNRSSQQPAVTISFNLPPGVAIGDAVAAIRVVEREANLSAAITTGFSGTAQLFEQVKAGQGLLLTAAVLVIYIILGVLYESFIHPITILSGLPSAGLGALLALQIYNLELSVIAIIGILLLIGIVKKNAIMMVDFAIERRAQGADAMTAIREAALIRFRPILMTSLAALFGTLPIAIGAGAGAELRQPLGIAVVGGLLVSQVLTLYITPVVYFYLDKLDTFVKGGARGEARRREQASITGEVIPVPVGAARASDPMARHEADKS